VYTLYFSEVSFLPVPVKEGLKGREEGEEDFSTYWVTLRMIEGTAI